MNEWVKAQIIPPALVTAEEVRYLERALAYGYEGYDAKGVLEFVASGYGQLWRFQSEEGEGAAVTHVRLEPCGRVLTIWLLAGRNLRPVDEAIINCFEHFARVNFCTKMRAYTRDAMARHMKQLGFESRAIVVERAVEAKNGQ